MCEDHRKEISEKSYGDYDRHKILVHFGYGFSGFILTAIVDYLFLWPENHLAALLAIAAWLSVTAIVELTVWGYSPLVTVSVVIGLFAASQVAYWIVGPIRVPDVEITGILQPGNDPIPNNPCDNPTHGESSEIPSNALRILIGTNAFTWSQMGTFTAIKVGNCRTVWMTRSPEGISVNGDLYDGSGKLIVRIRNNAIDAISGEHSKVTRNGDLSTLVITDQDKREILYVRYMNPLVVRVRGIFSCSGHAPVVIHDIEPIPGFFLNKMCFIDNQGGISLR